MTNVEKLIALHTALLEENPYCYFELAYTRTTMWMAWLCTNAREADPDRVVLANGQGETPEAAAALALAHYEKRNTPATINVFVNRRVVAVPRNANNQFILSYEEVVRIVRPDLDADVEVPIYTVTCAHTKAFRDLPAKSLTPGETVICTPEMDFTCVDTSNA